MSTSHLNTKITPRSAQNYLFLAESEERSRRLYEATPAMLHSLDMDGRILTVSDLWLERIGYSRTEVVGRFVTDFLTPESHEYSESVVLPSFLKSGHCENIEYRMVTSGGEVLDVLISATLDRDQRGQPVSILARIEDVTLQKRAERALAAERQRLANFIEGAGVATWEWNVQTGETRFDECWAEMLGLNLEDLGQTSIQTWREYMHPEDRERSNQLLQRHVSGDSVRYECETRLRHREGHWVWTLDRGAVMTRTADGRPEWVSGTHKDITERKQQEEALRKSEEFLDRTGRLAGIGGWEVDLIAGEVYWSAETYRIHGLDPDYRPTLEKGLDFYAIEARPTIIAAVERAAAGGEGWDLELPVIRADGHLIWVRTVGSAEFRDGRPVRLTGAFQDITARVAERLALRQANDRVNLAADSGGIGIWDLNLVDNSLIWDSWMHRLYGMQSTSTAGTYQLWSQHLHPDDRARAEEELRDCLNDIRPFDTEFRIVWGDGTTHHLRGTGQITRDESGRAVRMIGANWDITEARRLSSALEQQHELLRVTLHSIGDGVITADAGSHITWLNPVAERMTGWSTAEALGRPLPEVFHILNEKTRQIAESPVALCLDRGNVAGLPDHTILISRDGIEFGIEDSAAPIRNDRGEVLGAVLVFHDVTEQRRLSGEMSHRASHDALTGLVNRSEFEVRLRRILQRVQVDGSQNSLLFIDLDQFKVVNDSCGHAVGDLLLHQVSKLLAGIIRVSDTLARLGGDEFAIILDVCPLPQAQVLAQRICDRMDSFRFIHDDRPFRIGASVGLVPVDDRWSTAAAVMQAADTSCYAAKEAGRNRVHVWSDTEDSLRVRQGQTQWAVRIEHALDENRFALFAQRIKNLRSDACGVFAEVLIRMVEKDGSLVQPGAFLPAAERFHLAGRIDRWVLARVIAWMKALPSLDFLECLNVNLSGQSIGDRAFHRWAIEVLSESGPALRGRLCLEITETAAVTNISDAALFIEQARAIGVRVALDDFGAGASWFGYLKKMPVDSLKIDGQFIRDLVSDPLEEAAVRCFADVAKVVGMKTVAEFVEDPLVLERLRTIGVDFAQGFLIHRPAPIEELLNPALALV